MTEEEFAGSDLLYILVADHGVKVETTEKTRVFKIKDNQLYEELVFLHEDKKGISE